MYLTYFKKARISAISMQAWMMRLPESTDHFIIVLHEWFGLKIHVHVQGTQAVS